MPAPPPLRGGGCRDDPVLSFCSLQRISPSCAPSSRGLPRSWNETAGQGQRSPWRPPPARGRCRRRRCPPPSLSASGVAMGVQLPLPASWVRALRWRRRWRRPRPPLPPLLLHPPPLPPAPPRRRPRAAGRARRWRQRQGRAGATPSSGATPSRRGRSRGSATATPALRSSSRTR